MPFTVIVCREMGISSISRGSNFLTYSFFASQINRRARFSNFGLRSLYSSLVNTRERIVRLIYRSAFLPMTWSNRGGLSDQVELLSKITGNSIHYPFLSEHPQFVEQSFRPKIWGCYPFCLHAVISRNTHHRSF